MDIAEATNLTCQDNEKLPLLEELIIRINKENCDYFQGNLRLVEDMFIDGMNEASTCDNHYYHHHIEKATVSAISDWRNITSMNVNSQNTKYNNILHDNHNVSNVISNQSLYLLKLQGFSCGICHRRNWLQLRTNVQQSLAAISGVEWLELHLISSTNDFSFMHVGRNLEELEGCSASSVPNTTTFMSNVLLTLDGTNRELLLDHIGDQFISSYNTAFQQHIETPCEYPSFYRNITKVSVLELDEDDYDVYPVDVMDPSDSDLVFVKLSITAQCLDCGANAKLFYHSDDYYNTTVEGNITIPTEKEFSNLLATDLSSSPLLLNVTYMALAELVTTSCNLEEIPFTKRVIVEFEQFCDFDFIDEKDNDILGETYVNVYNSLAAQYCDLYFRRLDSATIVEQGSLTVDGFLPVEMQVTGTLHCVNGCDPDDLDLFDIPEVALGRSLQENQDSRFLDDETRECYCPVDAIAYRGPAEYEFIAEYRDQVRSLTSLDCVEAVANCTFGTSFESTLIIALGNFNQKNTSEEALEQAALDALNALFRPDDPTVCNREFRIFQDVEFGILYETASPITLDSTPPSSAPSQLLPRLLQESTNVSNITVPVNVTIPTNSTNATNATEAPIVAPTFGTPDTTAYLYITGVCSGCGNDVFFDNQISGRRRFLDAMKAPEIPRFLQDSEAVSNCYCSLDTTSYAELPTVESFEETFERFSGVEILETEQVSPSGVSRNEPTPSPVELASLTPTNFPTFFPTNVPSSPPSDLPTPSPTPAPTELPTFPPTKLPTPGPTESPTSTPSDSPTPAPSKAPTSSPSEFPTSAPSEAPSQTSSEVPTLSHSGSPTSVPSNSPTTATSKVLSLLPSQTPTSAPSESPTSAPSNAPTPATSEAPSFNPSAAPSIQPTVTPSKSPTTMPSKSPTLPPSLSLVPSITPTKEVCLTDESYQILTMETGSTNGGSLTTGDLPVSGLEVLGTSFTKYYHCDSCYGSTITIRTCSFNELSYQVWSGPVEVAPHDVPSCDSWTIEHSETIDTTGAICIAESSFVVNAHNMLIGVGSDEPSVGGCDQSEHFEIRVTVGGT